MSVADDLTEALGWMIDQNSPDLATYATAIGLMFNPVETYAADQDDGTLGWSILLDVSKCPVEALPYLAQYIGERLPDGLSEADQRTWIINAPNQYRGTPLSIVRAAQRWLTGQRMVQIQERWNGPGSTTDIDHITVIVFADACPDPGKVQAELRKAVPADIVLDFTVSSGQTWLGVLNSHGTNSTWTQVLSVNQTWAQIKGAQTGFILWTS